MKLLFEKSISGRRANYITPCQLVEEKLPKEHRRSLELPLPELSETDVSRHYSDLERRSFGVNQGFYPLGSCTMKYNPKINEQVAGLPGFAQLHPLQPAHTVQGALKVLKLAEDYLCELTGMDAMTFAPAAGAHGEFTGLLLIKKYHEARGDKARSKIIVPDSAHGTNPATVSMCGMELISIPSGPDGCVDLQRLRAAVGADTAGLMLTNPNTLGIFERDILEITQIIHEAGGLVYYDGANLNAVVGVVRPGDMGFDCVHLNLHKTFSTPHGGGGPGSGAVGCKDFLARFLPRPQLEETSEGLRLRQDCPESIGKIRAFYGNYLVVIRALTYLLTLGKEGFPQVAKHAVLNANYLMKRLEERFAVINKDGCMHEFVITMEREAKEKGFTAMDMAKALLDHGMHPPTMYFPLIVKEALMVEPTETEGKETLDEAAERFLALYEEGLESPEKMHQYPRSTVIGRPDEVTAARRPVLRYRANGAQ
jgi:glycine dehydrogenase subunit 2